MSGPGNAHEVDGALTRDLRRRVLRPWFGPDDTLPGDGDADAVHIAVLTGERIVATCFVRPEPSPWLEGDTSTHWRLRAMASDPDVRGQGYGRQALAAATQSVARRGGRWMWCHARDYAIPFYERNGWQAVGEVFTEGPEQIPHRNMWRRVDAST